jgi:hypothetical protein
MRAVLLSPVNGTYKPAHYVDPDKELPALKNCHDPIS